MASYGVFFSFFILAWPSSFYPYQWSQSNFFVMMALHLWDNFQNWPFSGVLFVSKWFLSVVSQHCILCLSLIFYFDIICYCFSLHFHLKNCWLNFNSITCVHYPVGLLVVNVYFIGWYNYYCVSCTHYSVSCKHLLCRLYVCTYYSISCKHFAKFMSATLPLVCTSYCVSCMHYSSCTHYSVGCMPYSVSCVHYSVKLWKVWTQESFHCGQQKEPAIYSWSAALF